MKTRTVGTSFSLLLFGAAVILLIGAFARFDSSVGTTSLTAIPLPPAPSLEPADAPETGVAPVTPANLSPGLDEVVKLAQAHVGNDVILSFVQNSGRTYHPSSQELLYLTDLGISQKVLAALYSNADRQEPPAVPAEPSISPSPASSTDFALSPAPPVPETTLPPEPPQISDGAGALSQGTRNEAAPASSPIALDAPPLQDPASSYFFNVLTPYGQWLDLGEQGWFWQPTVVATTIGWQPYRDHGGWLYTESGWYWRSDYSWAWAAFHYGRWLNHPRHGWVWRPGNTWAPAWVVWRNTAEHAGWAALPPGAPFNLGGHPLSAFGLTASSFTFVPFNKFLKNWTEDFSVGANQFAGVFRASAHVNNMSVADERILNLGVTTSQISSATHRPVRQFTLRDTPLNSVNQMFEHNVIGVYRPAISEKAAFASAGEARLAQLEPSQDAGPEREIPGAVETRGNVFGAELPRPRTPPPAIAEVRPFSFNAAPNQSVFPPRHFEGRFAPVEFDRPQRPGAAFGSRESEPLNPPAPYEGRPAGRFDRGEERFTHPEPASSPRPSQPEAHNASPSASSPKTSGH